MTNKYDLIEKLNRISSLYKQAKAIKSKIHSFVPKDNYERIVSVPDFPGGEDKNGKIKNAVDHSATDAIEEMSKQYDLHFAPKKPKKPKSQSVPKAITTLTDAHKGKMGIIFVIAIFVGVISLMTCFGNFITGQFLVGVPSLIVAAACGVVIFKFRKKLNEAKRLDAAATQNAIKEYEQSQKAKEGKYAQDIKEYETLMADHQSSRSDFINEYKKWREIYLKSLEEEGRIKRKLEEDRLAEIERIETKELTPVLEELVSVNDIISDDYVPAIDTIIDFLKSGRADDLKEALNLYEEMLYRERQLQLQREQEAQRQYAEERRHREEMRLREEQERRRRYDEEQRQRKEDERRAVEKKEKEALEKKAVADAERKCHWCANWKNCGMRHNPPLNCAGFRPHSTHQI